MLPTSLPPSNEFGRSATVLSNGTNLNGDFDDQELLQEAIPETLNKQLRYEGSEYPNLFVSALHGHGSIDDPELEHGHVCDERNQLEELS